jgi:hypothetical protein
MFPFHILAFAIRLIVLDACLVISEIVTQEVITLLKIPFQSQ